jgi:capsular exopolysaccharide synthesis family protein
MPFVNSDLALTERDGPWPLARYEQRPEQQNDGEGSALDLATLIGILREWRWLIIASLALGAAAAIVYSLLSTPMYRSSVTIEVNPPNVEVSAEQEREQRAAPQIYDLVATNVGLLKSRSLALRVAEDLNLGNNKEFVAQEGEPGLRLGTAANKVLGGLSVTTPEMGTLIKFDYVSEDPQVAAQVANGIADAFINQTLQRRYEASAYARNFLERQIAKTRSDLERSERQLVGYAQAQGIISTGSPDGGQAGDTASPTGGSLIALNTALADATARRVAAEGAYRASRSSGPTMDVNTSTQELRNQRATLQSQYQEKRELMKPEHPEMLSLQSRIAELNRQIASEGSTVASGRSNSLLADYRGALAAEQALQSRVAQLKSQVLNLRGRSIQYTILQREVDTNRALYDALLQRYKEIGVAGGVGMAPVSVVDRAEVAREPFKPNLTMNLLIGAILGLVAGIGAAIALEFLNDTINTRDDVRKKLGLACLGVIPKRSGRDTFIDDLQEPTSPTSEAYSTVVTSLRFSTEQGVPKVLMLTSARPSEGKSSSALALAQNFARQGNRVLLLDADLRKPAFKSASEERGVTKLLTENTPIQQHISQTMYDGLWLLPAGPTPPNPADLLSTGRFAAILREASANFDIVIVDAPPVLGLADSPLLAGVVKNVMIVVESGKTRTGAAVEAVRLMRVAGAHILGATLTKATNVASNYGYGYGYGYGAKYGGVDSKRNPISLITDGSNA